MIEDPVKINEYTYKTINVKCGFCKRDNVMRVNKEGQFHDNCWSCGLMIVGYNKEIIIKDDQSS
jgi:anaerobic glycerol-3-phosphate dehydrogenase